MLDSFVFLAPLLLLAVVGLLAFVGCDVVWGFQEFPEPDDVKFGGVLLEHTELAPTDVVTAPFTAMANTGNLIVVWLWFHTSSGQTVLTVSDGTGNVYEPADVLAAGKPPNFAAGRQQVFFAKNVVPSGGNPLTITFSGPLDPGLGVAAFEYRGADQMNPLVAVAQDSGFGSAAASPAMDVGGAVVVFGAVHFSGNGTNDPAANSRLIQNGNVAEDYFAKPLPLQIKAVPGNPANQDWIAQMVAFK